MDKKEHLKAIYSSKRKLKLIIRKLERVIAAKLEKYIASNQLTGDLPRDIEWFVSWSLKLMPGDMKYWCDGINNLKLKKASKNQIKFKAVSLIGPEDGSGKTQECQIEGEFLLTSTKKELKAYRVQIKGEGLNFQLNK